MFIQSAASWSLHKLSSILLSLGVLMLVIGVVAAYRFDHLLAIGPLIAAHTMTILGPALLKIGYVMRLLAANQAKEVYQLA